MSGFGKDFETEALPQGMNRFCPVNARSAAPVGIWE